MARDENAVKLGKISEKNRFFFPGASESMEKLENI